MPRLIEIGGLRVISYRTGVLAFVTAAGLVLAVPAAVAAPSADILIGAVYGGGGNSGAALTSDFIELTNAAPAAVDLDGWSVQYLPASPSAASKWQVTPLAGSVAPGGRYLVAESTGLGGTVALPTPDASGGIAMAAGAGTVALVQTTIPLTCLTAADCAADSAIHDLVGYGAATVREANPAPAASNTTSVSRASADTDDNATDFTAGEPTPTNSKGETAGSTTPPVVAKIHDIQGSTRVSPLKGHGVSGVTGVVTAIRSFGSSRGFWFTDPLPDSDPRTSEGLFVFTGSATPAVSVGDAVTVSGTVSEYYPDSPTDSIYQSTTELTGPQWTIESSGKALPAPTVLTPATVPDEPAPQPGGNIESLPLAPAKYALDFWEAHEGEIVSVSDARVVGPTTAYDELYVTTKPKQNPTNRGGTVYLGYDEANTGVLKIESLIPYTQRPFPVVDTGDELTGVTSGPVE